MVCDCVEPLAILEGNDYLFQGKYLWNLVFGGVLLILIFLLKFRVKSLGSDDLDGSKMSFKGSN